MTEKDYYDKYWNNEINGGMLNNVPIWSEDNLKWHLRFFKKYFGERVLDVGAGDGTFLNYLTRNISIKKAIAVELSNNACEIGSEKFSHLNFVQEDIGSLQFESGSFDSVCMIEVIEHLLDVDQALSELNRVLTAGGYLLITTTDFNLLKKIIIATFFWDRFFFPNNPHIRFFTKKRLSNCAKNTDLD